jgi:pimeloyl-ACP methyl ester carboxylesterase
MTNIHYKNTKIAFADIGHGETIVLLHGFLENSSMWQFFFEAFAASKRIVTIDLLGHGHSDSLGYMHSMTENANAVYAVLQNLGIQKCSVIGHSMGGYVALAFAEAHPKFIEKLVLLNSTAASDSAEKKINRDRAISVVKKDFETFVRMSIANLFAEKNREKLHDIIEITKQDALKTPLQGIVASLEGMKIREDKTIFFRNLKAKKLLIHGQKDSVLNVDEAKSQTENSDIQLVILPDGHMSHLENTIELKKVFQTFFE